MLSFWCAWRCLVCTSTLSYDLFWTGRHLGDSAQPVEQLQHFPFGWLTRWEVLGPPMGSVMALFMETDLRLPQGLVHVLLEKWYWCFEKCLEAAGEEGFTVCVCDLLCGCCQSSWWFCKYCYCFYVAAVCGRCVCASACLTSWCFFHIFKHNSLLKWCQKSPPSTSSSKISISIFTVSKASWPACLIR